MTRTNQALVLAISAWSLMISCGAEAATWGIDPDDPRAAATGNLYNGPKGNYYVAFIVEFLPELSCIPEFSLVMIEGKILGRPEKQEWIESRMQIWADDELVSAERTAAAEYTNGFSWASVASEVAIEKLSNAKGISVQPMKNVQTFEFLTDGMQNSIADARRACQ